jgi:hypothetical protein
MGTYANLGKLSPVLPLNNSEEFILRIYEKSFRYYHKMLGAFLPDSLDPATENCCPSILARLRGYGTARADKLLTLIDPWGFAGHSGNFFKKRGQ